MSQCRVCDAPLTNNELVRGICDICETSIASAIKKKIIRLSQTTSQTE
ncbi:MAG: hypothetical protein M0Z31_09480 [Clostridia bacterium]|nr:hypothetical protein [Clostridia bacterium]